MGGHCLITGMPGTAKTLMVRTIAQTLGLTFRRIQFTPDLMPSDITGTDIIEEDITTGHRKWTFVEGPIFGNVVLADEINRTPPKTQAAMLEAMQERSCTVRGHIYKLPAPFFVLATQNPIELEGTYPLPEAQLDRFLFNAVLDYLSASDELKVVDLTTATKDPEGGGGDQRGGVAGVSATGADGADRRVAGEVCGEPGAGDAAQERKCAGLCEEVCELWREYSRGAVYCAGGEGARAEPEAIPRDLRGHYGAGDSGAAAQDSAELPCGVGAD